MKRERQQQRGVPFTKQEAQVFRELFDRRKRLRGPAARDYMNRYIRLKARAFKLEKQGLKVRISLPDFPRRPVLIIEK